MRAEFLAAALSLFTAAAGLGTLTCRCPIPDCLGAAPIPGQTGIPCHKLPAQPSGKTSGNRECCGLCRIEKAEPTVKPTGMLLAGPAGGFGGTALAAFPADPLELSQAAPLLLRSPRSNFFVENILNVTYSLRAPP